MGGLEGSMDGLEELRLGLDLFGITRHRVREAMRKFDKDFRGHESDTGTGYFVKEGKKRYPPKRLLALTIGRASTKGFAGGEQTNSVFKKVGFDVRPISEAAKQLAAERAAALRKPVPPMKEVVRGLFSQRWRVLNRDVLKDRYFKWPGVYLIASAEKGYDLDGEPVAAREVLYVGMSNHATLAARLRQFLEGIEHRSGHSAGQRFGSDPEWRHSLSRAGSKLGGRLYFASGRVPCITRKGKRKGRDLKKMGVIAAAEQFALARVLEKVGREPRLNKQ
jgi:hypothetical protein